MDREDTIVIVLFQAGALLHTKIAELRQCEFGRQDQGILWNGWHRSDLVGTCATFPAVGISDGVFVCVSNYLRIRVALIGE